MLEPIGSEVFMIDFYDLKNLPKLYTHRRVMQASSFDRKEENGDFEQYLYTDKDGSMVMFEDTGRGCIKSIWAAVTRKETILNFYFDGEDTPRYTCSLTGLFTGELEELVGPANTFFERGHYEYDDCHCGNCFIPIPYEKGLKITVSGDKKCYYHIMYEKYDADAPKELCDGTYGKAFEAAFLEEKKEDVYTYEKTAKLESQYTDMFTMDGPGVITCFTVEAHKDADISNVKLDINFDKEIYSQVATPISHLFANPMGYTDVKCLGVDTRIEGDRQILTFRLPMPFWKYVNVCFVDMEKDGVEITLKVRVEENDYDRATTGTLHARYAQGLTEIHGDWLLGEFNGRGNFVGAVQTCFGGQWCEGNEHFYIDGEKSPSINGTGTEDFYLGCYWPNMKYDSPVAGCVNDVYEMGGNTLAGACMHRAGYYRYLCDMPISFEKSIKLAIQHGAVGQTYSDYSSLVLVYLNKEAGIKLTDVINVESEGSRVLHSYESSGERYCLTGKVEGERKCPVLSREGYLHSDKISFKAAIAKENSGVVLRRLLDLSKSPQRARVYVDGVFAGDWADVGYNDFAPFGDSDFAIPGSLTNGKEMLNITLETEHFTDFEYKVFTRK